MQIKWLGHACFLLATGDGVKVLTDPYDESIGYPLPPVSPDVVTVSHQHFDHNAVGACKGEPAVVEGSGTHQVKGLTIRGVATFHDKKQGAQRGPNTVFVIEAEGLRICHLGDLGHPLDAAKLREIGPVDVLLTPVGGTYTIDAEEAASLVKEMKPRIAVPMHYKTAQLKINIAPVDGFLRQFTGVKRQSLLEVMPDKLPPATDIVVLELSG
ncbi:MAG TPA: MBL fold metallo-hydrolase [Desulfotomaculum sp.]|nr:MBL fold metallo-hydrolase [Desulfotomaculum sp.]